ncbi:response regulator [Entomomonas sp. E2T0]|uniref:response regulator n=1 Tax=Entomomonas sp. E2T0 TaxID=2930213 RepID=UPI0022282B0E|nr:response regulator [Entomomonas sp. E2T0]UYZ84147.1 response regulator [Entomomonas sp. E2T0]
MSQQEQDSPQVFDFHKRKKGSEQVSEDDSNLNANLQEILAKVESSQKLKIVIFDIDVKAMNALSSILKPQYDVYCLTDPLDALKIIGTKKIALVISDQALPNMNILGVDFLLKAKKIAPNTSRILLAGQLDFGKAKLSLEKGDVFKLIKKPFDDNRLLEFVNAALELYLEQSGSLASAAAKLQKNSPNFDKEITIAKTIPASANPVLVKCSSDEIFEEIKASYTGKALFIRAEDRKSAIKVLETTIVKAVIYFFERANILEDHETIFLSQVKRELPHLSIIAVVNKDKTNYQDIINLLSEQIIFSYFPFNTRAEKICQQLSPAIDKATRLYEGPIYLKWPPPERVEEVEEEEVALADKLTDISSKVKEGFLSGIRSVKNLFGKKD